MKYSTFFDCVETLSSTLVVSSDSSVQNTSLSNMTTTAFKIHARSAISAIVVKRWKLPPENLGENVCNWEKWIGSNFFPIYEFQRRKMHPAHKNYVESLNVKTVSVSKSKCIESADVHVSPCVFCKAIVMILRLTPLDSAWLLSLALASLTDKRMRVPLLILLWAQ